MSNGVPLSRRFLWWENTSSRLRLGMTFWFDCWIGDVPLRVKFPRLFALDLNKEASVAVKLSAPIDISFRRNARGGIEEHLLADLTSLMDFGGLYEFRWWGFDHHDGYSFQVWQVSLGFLSIRFSSRSMLCLLGAVLRILVVYLEL
ncbi:hypothetical protein Tco_0845777 [Tanacetum coccineum]